MFLLNLSQVSQVKSKLILQCLSRLWSCQFFLNIFSHAINVLLTRLALGCSERISAIGLDQLLHLVYTSTKTLGQYFPSTALVALCLLRIYSCIYITQYLPQSQMDQAQKQHHGYERSLLNNSPLAFLVVAEDLVLR